MFSGKNERRWQSEFYAEAMKQVRDLLERRRVASVFVRMGFFDENGPRGGVAIRCALTVAARRGTLIRVQHTALTHGAAFYGALAILKRQLTRRIERQRHRTRYPVRGTAALRKAS
jgi:hypothetical protein